MKKQALSLLLALSLISVPALAKENSADNFVRSKTYAGQFSDLPEDHTFYENVAALYEYGLSVGQADGTYGLTVPMTVGQSVIFAGRIRSLYRTGDPEAGPAAFTAAAIGLKDAQRVLTGGGRFRQGSGRAARRCGYPSPDGPCAGKSPAGNSTAPGQRFPHHSGLRQPPPDHRRDGIHALL